jgi:hypothetical protein
MNRLIAGFAGLTLVILVVTTAALPTRAAAPAKLAEMKLAGLALAAVPQMIAAR